MQGDPQQGLDWFGQRLLEQLAEDEVLPAVVAQGAVGEVEDGAAGGWRAGGGPQAGQGVGEGGAADDLGDQFGAGAQGVAEAVLGQMSRVGEVGMGSGEQVAQVVGQGLAGEVQGWIVVAQAADAAFFEPLLRGD